MRNRWQGRIVILTVLLLAAMALVAIPAGAQSDDSERVGVDTRGVVDGQNRAASILCKWELPDAQPSENGMQYGGKLGRYYDGGAGYPCALRDGGFPNYDQNHTVLSVMAVAHDLDDKEIPVQPIELWSAVTHPAGLDNISDVYWDIYHPDRTPKDQFHGRAIDPNTVDDELGARWDGSQYQIVGERSMWYAASPGTEQVRESAVEDPDMGLVALTLQRRVDLYRAYLPLHKHQPCGRYLVENHVVANGVDTMIRNFIYVHCFIDLQIDFDGINWGLLTPGDSKVLNGNLGWSDYEPDGPFGSYNMTVGNGGSGEMRVGVAFEPLVQRVPALPKLITRFDAAFGISPSNLQWIDPIMSGEEPGVLGKVAWFEHDYYRTLCANETGKLDLSVHPQETIPNGIYAGGLVVYGMGYGAHNDVATTTTDTPPPNNDKGICNNTNGVWDLRNPGAQRPDSNGS